MRQWFPRVQSLSRGDTNNESSGPALRRGFSQGRELFAAIKELHQQIDSTAYSAQWASSTTRSFRSAVELRLCKKSRCLTQNLITALQLTILPLQLLEPLAFRAGHAGASAWSRSAWRTNLRSVSAVQPIFAAIEPNAAHCESYSA
jgi:hypothetical protein